MPTPDSRITPFLASELRRRGVEEVAAAEAASRGDHRVLAFGLGLTDVLKTVHSGDDTRLNRSLFKAGAEALRTNIDRYSPKIVCFTSKNAYLAFTEYGDLASFGLQGTNIGSSRVFVTPSPSGRIADDRIIRDRTRLEWFRKLASLIG